MKKFSLVKEDKDSIKTYEVRTSVVFTISAKSEGEANEIIESELNKTSCDSYKIEGTNEIQK